MNITPLSEKVSVTGQIRPENVPDLADKGFRTIICNRPDGEEPDQPVFHAISEAANACGISAHYIPVGAEHSVEMQKDAFTSAIKSAEGPVLAYCRTGNRSAMIHKAACG